MWLAVTWGTRISDSSAFNKESRIRKEMWVTKHLFIELLVDHVENLNVDGQHEEQGGQHPAEEVEVDHVVHADDRLKLAGHLQVFGDQGAVVAEVPQVVPAHHGHEAHDNGHQPAEEHGQACPPRRHYSLVAVATREQKLLLDAVYSAVNVAYSASRLSHLPISHHSNTPLDIWTLQFFAKSALMKKS